jgi:tripartite-type tricarboxylate transporter receptor subunit TctC
LLLDARFHTPRVATAAEFDAMLKSDIRNWGAAVRRLGIKVN